MQMLGESESDHWTESDMNIFRDEVPACASLSCRTAVCMAAGCSGGNAMAPTPAAEVMVPTPAAGGMIPTPAVESSTSKPTVGPTISTPFFFFL